MKDERILSLREAVEREGVDAIVTCGGLEHRGSISRWHPLRFILRPGSLHSREAL